MPFRKHLQPMIVIVRIVCARGSVKPPISQAWPASRLRCQFRTLGWIGSDTGNLEAPQKLVDRETEPAGMTRLQGDRTRMYLSQSSEKLLCDTFVKGELRRKLEEHGPSLSPRPRTESKNSSKAPPVFTSLAMWVTALGPSRRRGSERASLPPIAPTWRAGAGGESWN